MTTAAKSSTTKTFYIIRISDSGNDYQCIVEGKSNAFARLDHSGNIYSVIVYFGSIVYEEGIRPCPSYMGGSYDEWYIYHKDGVSVEEIETEDLDSAKLLFEIGKTF